MKLLVIELCEKSTFFFLIYNVDRIKNRTNLGQTLKILERVN